MAKIFRTTDRIKVEVDDLVVTIAPLSKHQKDQLVDLMLANQRGNAKAANEALALAMKFSIKGIKGLTVGDDDEAYSIELVDGVLSDVCLEELMNLEVKDKIQAVCVSLLNSVPTIFKDPQGQPIPGIRLVPKGESKEGK